MLRRTFSAAVFVPHASASCMSHCCFVLFWLLSSVALLHSPTHVEVRLGYGTRFKRAGVFTETASRFPC